MAQTPYDDRTDTRTPEETCELCGRPSTTAGRIIKCRMCYKYFCPGCEFRIAGQAFCSKPCGDGFFFGDAESEEDLVDE